MMKVSTQEKLLKRRWYTQGINGVPAFIHAADVSGIKYMRQRLGFGYDNFIYVCRPDYIDIYYDLADLERLAKIVLPRCFNNRGYFPKLLRYTAADRKPFIAYIRHYRAGGQERIKKLSAPALVKEYQRAAELFYATFSTSHVVEAIALTTDIKLRDTIRAVLAKRGQADRFSEYFSALTQTSELSFASQYDRDLHKLAGLAKNQKSLREHINNYFWIQCDWRGAKDYDFQTVLAKLRPYERGQEKAMAKAPTPAQNKTRKRRLIKELRLPASIGRLIHLIDAATKWQDDRKRDVLMGVWLLDNMLGELGRRYRLPRNQLHYLLSEEMSEVALGKISWRRELVSRRQTGVYLFSKNEQDILTGPAARQFIKKLTKKDEQSVNEIDGITASLGKAIGRARVCLTLAEAGKLKPGEILVTTMTRPEFVPAMKRAAAVVTDEGGLTSHAAIVSRELGVPCLIGTKIATQVFKDGDRVEVNANHGWARKL